MDDCGEIVGTLEFSSSMNMEGSWGSHLLADNVKSVMKLFFHKTGDGSIELVCTQLGITVYVGLKFKFDAEGNRTLANYDGVMTLPDQAMDLLERHGVDCADMRTAIAWVKMHKKTKPVH